MNKKITISQIWQISEIYFFKNETVDANLLFSIFDRVSEV